MLSEILGVALIKITEENSSVYEQGPKKQFIYNLYVFLRMHALSSFMGDISNK